MPPRCSQSRIFWGSCSAERAISPVHMFPMNLWFFSILKLNDCVVCIWLFMGPTKNPEREAKVVWDFFHSRSLESGQTPLAPVIIVRCVLTFNDGGFGAKWVGKKIDNAWSRAETCLNTWCCTMCDTLHFLTHPYETVRKVIKIKWTTSEKSSSFLR